MSVKGKLRMLFLLLPLLAGALSGVPMRPEDIEKLMQMNQEEIVCVMAEDDESGKALEKIEKVCE